jgi:PAS domain S-box-containing protein
MKLSKKILIASIVPFLAIIVLYHFLSTGAFSKHLVEIFQQQANNSLTQIEEDIRLFFLEKEYELKLLTFISPPDQQQPVASRIALHSLLQNVESIFRISAINVRGREWLRINKFPSSAEEQALFNLFGSQIYQRPMLELAPFLGNIERYEDFPLPLIDLSLPVKERKSGEISGIIWAKISFQGIQTLLERYLPSRGKILLIRMENGEVLLQADDTKADYTILQTEVLQEIIRNNNDRGSFEKSLADRAATFFYRKFMVNDLPFLLVYYQPNEKIYFLADRLTTYNVFVILAGIVIFVLTSFLLIRIIITPLSSITDLISDLGQQYRSKGGEEEAELPTLRGDEVEQLRYSFTFLQKQLATYSLEIETFNQTMEQQIVEKTQELSELNLTLAEHQHHLEKMVTERTAELSRTNERLQTEIEERRTAQNALVAEKERLAVTLRSIGDGVITTDTKGTIVIMNKVAEKLTGWSQEDARGRPLGEIFHIINMKTGETSDNLIDEVLTRGEIIGLAENTFMISRDGTERNIADSGAPIRDKENKIVGVVMVFRDVTEKIKMEEDLLKARKLESIGVLAGGIAHDFNNILAAIMGNINLAAILVKPEEKVHELLLEAEAAAMRAKELTQQLLTFSKGGEPVKQLTSIANVIRDSASFILRGSNIRCEYNIPVDLWPVEVDTGQISQVTQNIIMNASHAMPEGGVVNITCNNIVINDNAIQSLAAGDYVKIAIKDRGIGISPHLIDKIFDPYFSTKHEGSGLGLAITHSIISKHNGHITVESEQGVGSTFTIYLPASKQKPIAEHKAVESMKIQGKGTIMIMDDEEIVRKVAKEMLSLFGYDVLLAVDGEQALEMYQQHMQAGTRIDALIMDLTIPGGMGGREAVTELLTIDPNAKAIVSSGYSNDPVMTNYREYGFSGVINKPFRTQDLAETIRNVLASQ